MDFIRENYVLILIILGAVIFAVIGFIAEKKGYIGNKKQEDDLIDFDELSKPKEGYIEPKPVEKPHEEDLSKSFDEMPDFNSLPTVEKKEEASQSDVSEDLYAPFGDQTFNSNSETTFTSTESTNKENVNEVVGDFQQSFVDVNKIVKESKDINNTEDKKDVMDLMQDQGNIDYDFVVEGAETDKKSDLPSFEEVLVDEEKDKKTKEEEELKNMWNY